MPLVQLFTKWDFLKGTPSQQKLVKERMPDEEVSKWVRAIGQDLEEEHIKETILQFGSLTIPNTLRRSFKTGEDS